MTRGNLSIDAIDSQRSSVNWLSPSEKEVVHKAAFFLNRDSNASHNFARFLPFQTGFFSNCIKLGRSIRKYYLNESSRDLIKLSKVLSLSSLIGESSKNFQQDKTKFFKLDLATNTCERINDNKIPATPSFDHLINPLHTKNRIEAIKFVFNLRAKTHNLLSDLIKEIESKNNQSKTIKELFESIENIPECLFMFIAYKLKPP